MKRLYNGLLMTFGMYTVLPLPSNRWDENALPLVMPLFPLCGVVLGGVWYAAARGVAALGWPLGLQAAAAALLPWALSGFIHLDGFMDTADAVCSRRPVEEKRRILKDSHVGAFGVIAFGVCLLVQFCAAQALLQRGTGLLALWFIPVLSRGVVAAAMLRVPLWASQGFGAAFRKDSKPVHAVIACGWAVLCLAAAAAAGGWPLLAVLGVELAVLCLTAWSVCRQLGGISGDLCGCILVLGEAAGLLAAALL